MSEEELDDMKEWKYWLDSAQYDLATAEAMFAAGRWVYVVFTCQQTVEKLVKGLYLLYIDDNVPRTHNISFLLRKFEAQLADPVPVTRYALFDRLHAFYLNGRYADFKQKLSTSISKSEAQKILTETKEAFSWLQTQKP